jgi:hypothetical protein
MKIKLNHLEDKGIYHFKLPYGTFVINGERYTNDSYKETEMTASSVPVIRVLNNISELTGYEDTKGDTLSVEKYKEARNQLSGYDNDGDMSFDNLEDEYAYKKFISKWKPKYSHSEVLLDVELEVQRCMLDCGSKYITSLFSLDTNQAQLVKLDRLQLQRDTLASWASENKVQIDAPTHSGLKFTKINNKYVFDEVQNGIYYNDNNPVLTMALQDALAKEKVIKSEMFSILNSVITPASSLSSIMLIDVQKKLQEIIRLAQQNKSKYLVDIIKLTKELQGLIKTQ